MATTKEQLLKKRYKAEEKKSDRIMAKYSQKYGKNWTINSLTGRERAVLWSALRRQGKAINALVDLEVKSGKIKRVR